MFRFLNVLFAISLLAHPATANPPPGFEVIDISYQEDDRHGWPHMNECGEIVFEIGPFWDPSAEIYRYDNGLLEQLTDNDVSDSRPDINDDGLLTWAIGDDGLIPVISEIVLGQPEQYEILGTGHLPRLNNAGHVVWGWPQPVTCAFESSIWLYDGNGSQAITDGDVSDQSPKLNEYTDIVWHRYYFGCGFGQWTSDIPLYVDGTETVLTGDQTQPVSPSINDDGDVAWVSGEFVELWHDGVTTNLWEGSNPIVNNVGDIAYQFNALGSTAWQIWVYHDGSHYQVSSSADVENAIHNYVIDMNDWGEMTWNFAPNGALTPSGVRHMRRIRTGEADFDGDVDLRDFAMFQRCMTGPVDTPRLCDCRFLDMDHDRDVDLDDYILHQAALTGPAAP